MRKIFYNSITNHTIEDISASKKIEDFGADYQEILIDENTEHYQVVNGKLEKTDKNLPTKEELLKKAEDEKLIQDEIRRLAIDNLKKQGKL